MPRSAYYHISRFSRISRISVLAVIAGSIISTTAACGGGSGTTPHANGTASGGGGTHPGASASASPSPTGPVPVYTATVPTISDGTNKVVIGGVSITFPSTVTDAAWSSDGTRLAYVDGDGNIATARPDGSGVLVLTQTKSGVKRAQPAFEDGGGEIVFSERGTDGVWRLMSVSANGQYAPGGGATGEALMDSIGDGTGDTAANAVYDASRAAFDGPFSILAYQHAGSAGPEIWVLDRNQRGPQGRKARDGASPTLSPDGSKIAFVGGDGQLYTEALPIENGSTAVKITVGVVGLTHPVWSPDGSRIAFGTASDVESVPTSAPSGGSGNPVQVESHSPGVPSYEPMTPTRVLRFSGDPVADSIAQSKAFYTTLPSYGYPPAPDGRYYASGVTLVGTSDPAALTVAALANPRGAVLFTQPGSLGSDTLAEIARLLGPRHTQTPFQGGIHIIGDTNAVSAGIEAQLKGLGYSTTRIADGDAIATAASANGPSLTRDFSGPVYVVSATDTPAILSIEALAGGHRILFTDNATMPAADEQIIDGLTFTGQYPAILIAVGGQAQQALASSWPGKPAHLPVTAVGGTNADLNALLVAKQFSDGPTEVALASTGAWQDALLAASNGPGMPLIVVDPQFGLSADAAGWLGQSASSVGTVVVYGDTSSIPDGLVQQAVSALNAPAGTNSVLNPGKLLPL